MTLKKIEKTSFLNQNAERNCFGKNVERKKKERRFFGRLDCVLCKIACNGTHIQD
jgi:hypothetical protein